MDFIYYAQILLNLSFLMFLSSSDTSFSADIIFKKLCQIDLSRYISYRQYLNICFYSTKINNFILNFHIYDVGHYKCA
jgi:hypothetical protein